MDPSTGGGPKQSLPIEIPPEEVGKPHRFWDSQPVPSVSEALPEDCGVIETKSIDEVRKTPVPLPDTFEWVELGEEDLQEIYELLSKHYVEDNASCFRFEYTMESLKWAIFPPDSKRSWTIGIKTMVKTPALDTKATAIGERKAQRKLVAFISGIPVKINIFGNRIAGGEVNFLCVHKKLRSRRLAPILIKELTRRINLDGVWHALYTAGIFIPRPVTDCRYYHRSMNVAKLVSIGFSALRAGESIEEAKKKAQLPDHFTVPGIRPMEEKDVASVTQLLNNGFVKDKIKLYTELNEDDVCHWLLTKQGAVYTYVKETEGKVTDFFSFYELNSKVLRFNQEYDLLKAAYNYYCNGTTMSRKQLLEQSIIAANILKYDVFNALDLNHNFECFQELQFGPGDGSLKYYLYNYKCPLINPNENGVILS
ncbi:glycylpeptide N-tetradecanoyltransferase [Gregarina niphandrodes]|uniref:Glycylpeptide N-tetradecanoyltransferase n=1 Tax=Gregarina niphandrodes TaxID=110365 RepID=A0A023B8N3_GRENI|nr:glycylpeptide N-tetradecanoyltransferase [Gregarina niphandrodes]EZG69603.1 glycylpeptide N-tetradecanoyltransferase [Gregarina niphandrodes]|eukprot:XP_011129997.1 glycylpeptide N-tetradecanoyltransferase [Gregarina niphandrodes]